MENMTYSQALERAKTQPVMRRHWKRHWLTFENGTHLDLRDDGSVHAWCPLRHDMVATDWRDAPQSPDEP
jgi:predicted glutamine amidotransferase